jgi:hypothetical protein
LATDFAKLQTLTTSHIVLRNTSVLSETEL